MIVTARVRSSVMITITVRIFNDVQLHNHNQTYELCLLFLGSEHYSTTYSIAGQRLTLLQLSSSDPS